MAKDHIRAILEKVLTWPIEDQERVARFAREVELRRSEDGTTDEEWLLIEERARRRDLATDDEVEALFRRHRGA